ncbi:MAG TPA: PAS domain-containing protein, partial [Albitalea sp.]|nr:PAS domain-containing protein [Albitalea sp.]
MSGRLPPACACAPAPAVLVWREAGRVRWTLNDAAREWPLMVHWDDAEWTALAQAVQDDAERGLAEGGWLALRLRWRIAAVEGGWLAWLLASDTGAVDGQAALRGQAVSTQLGLAVGLVGIALWRVDLASQRLHLNERGYELLGYDPRPEGLTIDEMRMCIHPDDVAVIERAMQQAMAGSGVIDAEARYRRPGGGYYTLLTRRIAERDDAGKVIALVGISLDISEQVQERERARQAAQSIELIAEATGVGVWTTDVDTLQSVWNGQMWTIYGISPQVRLPQAMRVALGLTEPADRARLKAAFRQLASGQLAAEELEFRIRRPDGEVRWVVGRGRFALHGERRVIFGVFIDVTEQRVTQERLRRAEQRTMLAAKAVGLAIWERDLVDGETWWDAQMYRLRGLSPDEARGPNQLRHSAIHPDDVAYVEQRTQEIIDSENDYTFDFRVVWPDGTVRWLATRGSVVRDEDGRALRILGINWDITEHKRGEDARREKATAEESSRAKSEFLSRMSHELRTPLNAVLGFSQLMLSDMVSMLPPGQRERADRIRNAGAHLLALIDDVLDLTSMEVGGVPLSASTVAVAPLVQETLQWLAPAAAQAEVALVAGPLDGSVLADAKRLRQVVSNLLSNAVKYNRRGGRVEVAVVDAGDPGASPARPLGLVVRDTGRGLTPAQLQRLFEPFNRLGVEREGIEGTGIGLTIVRALVERMGGRIEVHSRA